MTIYNYWDEELYFTNGTLFAVILGLILFAFFIVLVALLISGVKKYKNQNKKDFLLYERNNHLAVFAVIGGIILAGFIIGLTPEIKEKGRDIVCLTRENYITVEGDVSIDEAILFGRANRPGYRIVLTVGGVTLKPDNYFSIEAYNKLCSMEKAKVSYIIDGEDATVYDVYSVKNNAGYLWTTDSTVLLIVEDGE